MTASAGRRPAPAGAARLPVSPARRPAARHRALVELRRSRRRRRPAAAGRVLEIGCGHGLFSTYAALALPDRCRCSGWTSTRTRSPSARRRRRAACRPDLAFAVADPARFPRGRGTPSSSSTCCTCCRRGRQRALLARRPPCWRRAGCWSSRRWAPDAAVEGPWNAVQETLSVWVLGITAAARPSSTSSTRTTGALAGARGLRTPRRRLDRRRLHPHHLVIGGSARIPGMIRTVMIRPS